MLNTPNDFALQHVITPDGQQITYAVFGDPNHLPILHLHGGPGSGANPAEAILFNLERHRVVMFEQRGCGRSLPRGTTTNNTTQQLLADIEQLRQTLDIECWKVYGGSWGATLALEYAKQHPQRVIELILRGSFPARKHDLDWFIEPDGVACQYPTAYQQLCAALEINNQLPLTSKLYTILIEAGVSVTHHERAYQAALAWDRWEATIMGVTPAMADTLLKAQQNRIHNKLIYAHYCHHQFFLGDDGVIPGLEKLQGIPVTLIHGKHDQVCPLSAAIAIYEQLPSATLMSVDAGHSIHDKAIQTALWEVVNRQDQIKRST